MTDNDKSAPVISLAAVRAHEPRAVQEERGNLKKEGEDLGLPSDIVAATVDAALWHHWLTSLAQIILIERGVEHPDELTIVKLAQSMRKSAERQIIPSR
jgi:hypothetical protein